MPELRVASPVVRTLAKNAISNLSRTGISWIVVLLLPPLLVRVLDKPTYATWVLVLQIGAYVSLLDGGIQGAIARFVARAESLGDRQYLARVLSSAAVTLLICGVGTILVTSLTSWRLQDLFHNIPASIASESQSAILVIGISLAVGLPFSALAGFFQGMQRNEVTAIAVNLGKFVGASGTAWAAYHHEGIGMMALWVGFGNILQSLSLAVAWARAGVSGLIRSTNIAYGVMREFVLFCSAMLVSQFGCLLITGLDIPIVAAFDFRSAAYYAVAATISNMLVAPHGAIVSTIMPVAAAITVDEPHRLGRVLCKVTRYATALLCAMAVPIMLAMPVLLRVWVGRDYGVHALPLAEILVFAQLIRLTLMPYATIGFAAGQQHKMLISPFAEGIVNVTASLVLVHFLGAIGVALGTLIGAVVGVWIHFVKSMPNTECVIVSRRALLWTSIIKPLACGIPAIVLLWVLSGVDRTLSLHTLSITAGTFMTIPILLLLNFDSQERTEMSRLLFGIFHMSAARIQATDS